MRAFAAAAKAEQSHKGQPRAAYGASFVRETWQAEQRRQAIESAETIQISLAAEAASDPETQTKLQLKRLFRELPGHVSMLSAWALHSTGRLEPKVQVPPPAFMAEEWREKFEELFRSERWLYQNGRRQELTRRRRQRRNFLQNNSGFKEEGEVYEAEEIEFKEPWRVKSIVEDCWKAEYYRLLHRKAREDIPEREPLAARSDRLADVVAGALRTHYTEQNRPVLTHELADFDNPYMMKHSALERLLQERCVRNKLDERCLPRLLERQQDLTKLRREAQLPPEVLEPLAAFRGDVRWHFDGRERLALKLRGAELTLEAVERSGGDPAAVAAALPENAGPPSPDQVPGVRHPWRNHLGFESAQPRGVTGGTRFGQPLPAFQAQVLRLRYPTLQRVAHTLPADPKWRAHVVRTIRVLERSKHWDYASKLDAVNRMKEVYDSLRPSAEYTEKLDRKLVVNRVPSHLKRKFAKDVQYVKTFKKKYIALKSMTRYRPSLTATAPLKKEKAK